MELRSSEQIRRYVSGLGIGKHPEPVIAERLSGGVSCSVWKVTVGDERWVFKQALGKLNVEAEWFSDVRRIDREQQSMRFLAPMLTAGTVPGIVRSDPGNHLYIMTCAPDDAVSWKTRLMSGEFQPEVASRIGQLLLELHENSRSTADAVQKEIFADLTFFKELRIEPFHRFLQAKFPELKTELEELILHLTERGTCLVHGDFSPKNILVDNKGQLTLLDFEVSHWGNPVFDLAFMLTHLLLKGWALQRQADALMLMERFLQAYGFRDDRDSRLVGHTGALLLARIAGKSPAEYIKDAGLKDRIKRWAAEWIRRPDHEAWPQLKSAMKES